MKVVLVRKLAHRLDGVDVADRSVGDVLNLSPREAHLLLAEQWAIPDRRQSQQPPAVERRKHRQEDLGDGTEADVPHAS